MAHDKRGINMRKILIAFAAMAGVMAPVVAFAQCTTHTYYVNGKYTTCTTCCYGSQCNTNCY